MEENPYFKYKFHTLLYEYSKKYLPYKFLSKLPVAKLTPKKFKGYSIIITANVFFAAFAYLLIDLSKTSLDKVPIFLTCFILVALSAFLGGIYSALFTTAIISFETYLVYGNFTEAELDLISFSQIIFFTTGAIIISFLFHLVRDNAQVKTLREQEKRYARSFIELHDEYASAIKDIKARDEFLSMVSHELRTPLTVMLLSLHNMLTSIQSMSLANFSIPQLMKVLKNSELQIKWLTSMINDLLDISLITTGRMNLELEDTDLVGVTKQVKQSFSELLKKEQYKIKINATSSVIGKWDKVRIEQVITNLLSNAIKYGKSKPIEIKVFKSGSHGVFIIKDGGIGIPPQEQGLIFDLFKRAPGQGEYKKGLGVGLFITSQIIRMHNGKIKVSSIPAKGTSFTVELPLKK